MACLCCTVRDVHRVLKNMTPVTDFSERVCVNLLSFVVYRVGRDHRQAESIQLEDWPKVVRFFANLELTAKVVAHTAHNDVFRKYLSLTSEALPKLAHSVDCEDDLEEQLELAMLSLANIGRIIGEVDFAYLDSESATHIGEIVSILKNAEPMA
jgi:hypothetical protein